MKEFFDHKWRQIGEKSDSDEIEYSIERAMIFDGMFRQSVCISLDFMLERDFKFIDRITNTWIQFSLGLFVIRFREIYL